MQQITPQAGSNASEAAASGKVYFDGLTGLRGIGAVWVMLYHTLFDPTVPVLGQGYLAVDLFFVLSGFILSHAHRDIAMTAGAYGRFLRDRVARLFPMHLAALALLVLVVATYPEIHHRMINRFQPSTLLANALLMQNWGIGNETSWNAPSWSLSTEWLVSIGFPLFLLAARRFAAPAMIVPTIAGALAGLEALLLATHNPDMNVAATAGLARTVAEFFCGCLVYRLFERGVRVPLWGQAVAVALLAVGLSRDAWSILAVAAFPIVILTIARPSALRTVLSMRAMTLLGEISYSVYLLHWIVLQVFNYVRRDLGIGAVWNGPYYSLYLVVVLMLSWLTYRGIELRVRVWIRRLGRRTAIA